MFSNHIALFLPFIGKSIKQESHWDEFLCHVLHFGYISYDVIQFASEQKTLQSKEHVALLHALKKTYKSAIDRVHTAAPSNENAQTEISRDFANYVSGICNQFDIRDQFYHPFAKTIDDQSSLAANLSIIKKAIAALAFSFNAIKAEPLGGRIANALFYNRFTTYIVPDFLSYVAGPVLAGVWGAYMFREDLQNTLNPSNNPNNSDSPKDEIVSEGSEDQPVKTTMKDDPFGSLRNMIGTINRESLKKIPQKLCSFPLKKGSFFLPIPIVYGLGKFLKKIQIKKYIHQQNENYKKKQYAQEMNNIEIVHIKQAPTSDSAITDDIAKIESDISFLHNPEVWGKPDAIGTHGLMLVGEQRKLSLLPQSIAYATHTPIITLSFLQASNKQKVQAIVACAAIYASKADMKSIIIHIADIDYIDSGSKALDNITQILFDLNRNPYLNILIIGTAHHLQSIPELLREPRYFKAHYNCMA